MNKLNNPKDAEKLLFDTPSLFPRADGEEGISSAELFHHHKVTEEKSDRDSRMSALLVLVAKVVSTLY